MPKFDPETYVYDKADPSPWYALCVDQQSFIPQSVREDMVKSTSSWSRQFLLPLIRPTARVTIALLQVLKILIPNRFVSSKWLHYSIYLGMKYFVSPEANRIILRHFHLGSQILKFIARNAKDIQLDLDPTYPANLEAVKEELFLVHDINLFNFVIQLNQQLLHQGRKLTKPDQVNFEDIDPNIEMEEMPDRWTNFIDVESAIELYTPLYQMLLTDDDFWRASHSLQFDETVAGYVAAVLDNTDFLALVNNKHPLVPLITMTSGYRLMLHGLGTEALHDFLVHQKREQSAA